MSTVKAWWQQQPRRTVPEAQGLPTQAGPIAAAPQAIESEMRKEIERIGAELKELRLAFDQLVKERKANEASTSGSLPMGSNSQDSTVLPETVGVGPEAQAEPAAAQGSPPGQSAEADR